MARERLPIIRASEMGEYVYCARAWWLRRVASLEPAGRERREYGTALISLNLFLVNLLPIPALDGSHIMFSLIELARRGKKIPPEKEAMVHAVGFMMLMGLMVIITVSDVANWIGGASVLGGQ